MILPGIYYTIEFENVSVEAAQDFFALAPDAAGELVIVTDCEIFNVGGTADAGDAQEEFLRVAWQKAAAVGSGGSAETPVPNFNGMPASSIAARANDTTEAATPTLIRPQEFNIRGGLKYKPTPGEVLAIAGGVTNDVLVLSLLAAPADAILMSGSLTFCEMRF